MTTEKHSSRAWVVGSVLIGAILFLSGLLLANRGRSSSSIAELRDECTNLRAQIDACNTAIADLQAMLRLTDEHGLVSANGASTSDLALLRSLTELSLAQSNTAIVIERLLSSRSGSKPPETPDQALRRRQALEASAAQEQQRYDALKQQATELLLTLRVPDEVAIIPTSKALDMPSLQVYWPYFEAKKELEPVERLMQSLKIRLAQERVEAGMEAAGAGPTR